MSNPEQLQILDRADATRTRRDDATVLPLRPVSDLVTSAGPVVILAGTAASQRTAA